MGEYRVLYACGSIEHRRDVVNRLIPVGSLEGLETYRFPNSAKKNISVVLVCIASLTNKDKFNNICGRVRPNLIIFADNGHFSRAQRLDGPQVHISKRIVWGSFAESDGEIVPLQSELVDIGKHIRSALEICIDQENWKGWYVKLDHNDYPTGRLSDAYLVPSQLFNMVKETLDARPEIEIVGGRAPNYPRLAFYEDWDAFAMFAPTQCWSERESDSASEDSAEYRATADAMISLAHSIASSDCTAHGDYSTVRANTRKSTKSKKSKSGSVTFDGEDKAAAIDNLIFINKYLPNRSIDIIDTRDGSIIVDVSIDYVDGKILSSLVTSSVFNHLSRDKFKSRENFVRVREAIIPDIESSLPLYLLRFLDELDWIGGDARVSRGFDEEDLKCFGKRWSAFDDLAPLARLISRSTSLARQFSNCG